MGNFSPTWAAVTCSVRRVCAAWYGSDRRNIPYFSGLSEGVAKSLYSNILRVSPLDTRFWEAKLPSAKPQVVCFQCFERYSNKKICASVSANGTSKSFDWKILRANSLYAIFCEDRSNPVPPNPFRKKILQNLPQKNDSRVVGEAFSSFLTSAQFSHNASIH